MTHCVWISANTPGEGDHKVECYDSQDKLEIRADKLLTLPATNQWKNKNEYHIRKNPNKNKESTILGDSNSQMKTKPLALYQKFPGECCENDFLVLKSVFAKCRRVCARAFGTSPPKVLRCPHVSPARVIADVPALWYTFNE